MMKMLHVVLTHQPAPAVRRMVDWWSRCVPPSDLLVASGATRSEFEAIDFPAKIYCGDDLRLQTQDHQRERQSYLGVFQRVTEWLKERAEFGEIHFAEFDHVPLVSDLSSRLHESRGALDADVIGFHVQRVDGTNHPHYLYHAADPRFHAFLSSFSRRADKQEILSMFGSGSVWSRAAFERVAATVEPVPMYLEIALPTVAHHLGLRVADLHDEVTAGWMRNLGDYRHDVEQARAAGAWSLHPVKTLWDADGSAR